MEWRKRFVEMLFPVDRRSMNIEGAYMLKHQHMPESLFKYREYKDWSIKNLEDDAIWLNEVSCFNDPYDCAYTLNYEYLQNKKLLREFLNSKDCCYHLSAELKEEIINSEDPNSTLCDYIFREEPEEKRNLIRSELTALQRKMADDSTMYDSQRFAKRFKVCSFSERMDSLLMWAHYADYHKGFCLEYDIKSIHEHDYRKRFMYPVIYSEEMFDATALMLGDVNDDERFNRFHWFLAALIKAIDWQYEKEWRLVLTKMTAPHAYYMGKPTRLFIGAKMEEKNQHEIINICERKGIPYAKMKPHPRKFKLEPVSLKEAENVFVKRDA